MRWRPSGASPGKGAAAELEPVRILTIELLLEGFVASSGQRITDILLRGDGLPFLPDGADPDPDHWVLIAPDDLLAVIPPPLRSPPVPHEQVILRPAFADTGPYRITGAAHLRSNETLDEGFRRRQPFLPLTTATITHRDRPSDDVSVVIVNLDKCQAFGLAG